MERAFTCIKFPFSKECEGITVLYRRRPASPTVAGGLLAGCLIKPSAPSLYFLPVNSHLPGLIPLLSFLPVLFLLLIFLLPFVSLNPFFPFFSFLLLQFLIIFSIFTYSRIPVMRILLLSIFCFSFASTQ